MRTISILFLLALLIPMAGVLAQDEPLAVTVSQYGQHYAGQYTTPLYSLAVGNPLPFELEAQEYQTLYGPFALNATVYVRYPEDHDLWYSVYFRRPETVDEAIDLRLELLEADSILSVSFAQMSEAGEAEAILPPPFDQLANTDLEIVNFLIQYQDGSIRLYFATGTTLEEIASWLEPIEADYDLAVTIEESEIE